MTQQLYPRSFSLAIGNTASSIEFVSPDLSSTSDPQQFRVQFQVDRGDLQTPNTCDVRIFNADVTANRIIGNTPTGVSPEFSQLVLKAGYPGNLGMIFRGSIKQVRRGRIDQKDNYLDITAADGDEAYNFAPMAIALAAGQVTAQSEVEQFLKAMSSAAVANGQTITAGFGSDGLQLQLPTGALERAQVYYGLVRDELRDYGSNINAWPSIQDGAFTIIPRSNCIPTPDPPVISVASGLIGVPEWQQSGLRIRTLLNPKIKIGQLIKLDAAAGINTLRYGLDINSIVSNQIVADIIKNSPNGTYYVMSVNHSGDSRGQAWYSDLICLSFDVTVPSAISPNALVFPSAGPVGGPNSVQ